MCLLWHIIVRALWASCARWVFYGIFLGWPFHTLAHTLHILSLEHCRVPATNCILFVRRVVVVVIRTRIPSNIKYAVEKSGIQNLFGAIVIMCVVLCTIFLIYKKLFFLFPKWLPEHIYSEAIRNKDTCGMCEMRFECFVSF